MTIVPTASRRRGRAQLLGAVLVAVALVVAAGRTATRSDSPTLELIGGQPGGHPGGNSPAHTTPCDADGVHVGYTAGFRSDLEPVGHRVTAVAVDDVALDCRGFFLLVTLTQDGAEIGRAGPAQITDDDVALDTSNPPLASAVNDVHVEIGGDRAPPPCRKVHYTGVVLGSGTSDDVLDGRNGTDLVLAFGGDDTLRGFGGVDCLDGGEGDDTLHGGVGADVLLGGPGTDTLDGGAGFDHCEGDVDDTFVDCEEVVR